MISARSAGKSSVLSRLLCPYIKTVKLLLLNTINLLMLLYTLTIGRLSRPMLYSAISCSNLLDLVYKCISCQTLGRTYGRSYDRSYGRSDGRSDIWSGWRSEGRPYLWSDRYNVVSLVDLQTFYNHSIPTMVGITDHGLVFIILRSVNYMCI